MVSLRIVEERDGRRDGRGGEEDCRTDEAEEASFWRSQLTCRLSFESGAIKEVRTRPFHRRMSGSRGVVGQTSYLDLLIELGEKPLAGVAREVDGRKAEWPLDGSFRQIQSFNITLLNLNFDLNDPKTAPIQRTGCLQAVWGGKQKSDTRAGLISVSLLSS